MKEVNRTHDLPQLRKKIAEGDHKFQPRISKVSEALAQSNADRIGITFDVSVDLLDFFPSRIGCKRNLCQFRNQKSFFFFLRRTITMCSRGLINFTLYSNTGLNLLNKFQGETMEERVARLSTREAQRRERARRELSESTTRDCTFQPQINPVSRVISTMTFGGTQPPLVQGRVLVNYTYFNILFLEFVEPQPTRTANFRGVVASDSVVEGRQNFILIIIFYGYSTL